MYEANNYTSYTGKLGALYTTDETIFRLWAPTASKAYLNLYPDGDASKCEKKLEMTQIGNGAWEKTEHGNLDGVYYTYSVIIDGIENEAVDPYAKAAGVNGKRGMVVNLVLTNPDDWENDVSPSFSHPVDAILYELHIRDFSIDKNSGMENKGKYLAFTETGTISNEGLKTGVEHLAELGITHVHLLPSFDYCSVDERYPHKSYNWGYDPGNYNLPEGSYSTDPYNGHVRIKEFKQMIKNLHKNGLRVVMDVVYNHTGTTIESNFNKLVPGYYYRMDENGDFSDGAACDNETASERSMVRKFMVDSVVYWATEYNIDGFRFDLMGLHDIETMNAIRYALDEIDPSILLYGEGWTGGPTPLPEKRQALKKNTHMLDKRIAAFSDDIRDGIKGHVFKHKEPGFVNGNFKRKTDVMFGVAASCYHPQVDYQKLFYSKEPWAKEPSQTVTYASAHDNLTLWDKLKATCPKQSEAEYIKMNKLSALLVLTSQGISFIHAGEELARTKNGIDNSFISPDEINKLDWKRKKEYKSLFEYYKGLIALRKSQPLFRLQTAGEIEKSITFLPSDPHLLIYTINNSNQTLLVAVNADINACTITLPESGWNVLVNGECAGTTVIGRIDDTTLYMPPQTGFVLEKA